MTVETTTRRVVANGNDIATSFSFSPMVIYANSDLVVIKRASDGSETTLTEGTGTTNYSVTATLPGSGAVVYPASGTGHLATGEKLLIVPRLPLKQLTDLENQGGYFPDTQETQLDKLVQIDQQHQEQIDRSLRLAPTDTTGISLEIAGAPTALSFPQVNAAGTAMAWVTALSSGVLAVSSFVSGILNSASAAAFRTAIGTAIGTNVQAWDADLDALAGVTSAADKVPYFTGSGTASVATFTTKARTAAGVMVETVVQRVIASTATYGSTAVQTPVDDTAPLVTEGAAVLSITITPTTPATGTNKLRVTFSGMFSNSVAEITTIHIHQDGGGASKAVGISCAAGALMPGLIVLEVSAVPNVATTFQLRAGRQTSGTASWNGASARNYGGVAAVEAEVIEYTP